MNRRPPPKRSPRKPPPRRKAAPAVQVPLPLPFHREKTLKEARGVLTAALADGTTCPCCGQHAQIYRRKVHAGMAAWLVRLVGAQRRSGEKWVHFSDVSAVRSSRDYPGLQYWGLIEAKPNDRGFWRPTKFGSAFVDGSRTIYSHALVYDGECKGFDTSVSLDIKAALGTKFDFDDLMAGR